MHDWMNGWGMGFGFIFWLVIIAIVIVGVMWFVRSRERHSTALDLLEERYARGEIDRDEYLQKKRDLSD